MRRDPQVQVRAWVRVQGWVQVPGWALVRVQDFQVPVQVPA